MDDEALINDNALSWRMNSMECADRYVSILATHAMTVKHMLVLPRRLTDSIESPKDFALELRTEHT
jgi:hypothetical protein